MALLEVRDLQTQFKTDDGVVRAVDGVSFSLDRGQTIGIVGESGSGKSVTSLSILRLLGAAGKITGGSVTFDGTDLGKIPERAMRDVRGNRISMIFQDPMTSLNPFMTVERQISEVLTLHRGLSRADARTKAIEGLERVGIPDAAKRVDQYPHQFSGGMRQRVMIAIALACEPQLLIADEPTTALDVTIQAQILELIRTQQRDLGTAVILITHDLGVVAGMADEVAVMYAGRIVERGPAADLYAKPSHPYTRGLLQSLPRVDSDRRDDLVAIPGLPPDLSNLAAGCAFAPRCALVVDRCRETYPDLVTIGATHSASCWEIRS